MSVLINSPRGTEDILPFDSYKWIFIRNIIIKVCESFGIKEIVTPIFEHTELFLRSIGNTTDVVQKEMYTFLDKSERSLTLRPEGTASVVRAVLENGLLNNPLPLKFFYFGPFFRYEKPQAGRLRQFNQFGIEFFGPFSPSADLELILVAKQIFKILKLNNIDLEINSIGCLDCRPNYNSILKEYFINKKDILCKVCNNRLNTNPMRIIDCKNPNCKEIANNAPSIIDYICDGCNNHFKQLISYLNDLNISYKINNKIVRGLDYYNRTVFEFISNDLGAQSTICGGGRYDSLIQSLGGNHTPALGFGMGIERLLSLIDKQNIDIMQPKYCDIYICNIGEVSKSKVLSIMYNLSQEGFYVECDLMDRSFKSQMKYANKINAKTLLIIGENELTSNIAKLKNMDTGEEYKVNIETDLIDKLYDITLSSILNEFDDINSIKNLNNLISNS